MQARRLIERLSTSIAGIRTMVEGISAEEAVWRPATDQWSLLEVIAHLLDEEREDFRARLDLLLHRPGTVGPPINPQAWVLERRYNERDLEDTLQQLLAERAKSMAWLRGLDAPCWENSLEHPAFGVIRAGDILGSWVAHDLLHVRQLARIHWQHVAKLAEPHSVEYAGAW